MPNEEIIEKAARISVVAHKNQARKDGDNLPYIIHPLMVAIKLARYNFTDTVIAAALVHDVLEDCDYTQKEIKEVLGPEVLEIVKAVTNNDKLPWEEKKMEYVESVRRGQVGAKAVAVADKIHNVESLLIDYKKEGPKLWEKFNRGRDKKVWFEKEVLKMLKETWDHPLIEQYEGLVEQLTKLK